MKKKYYIVSFLILFILLISIPITLYVAGRRTNLRQYASTTRTATIAASPVSTTVTKGSTFTVTVTVDGGGTPFNAAQSTVSVSSNLSVLSLTNTASSSGGCNLQYVAGQTPSISNLSFAGAILSTFSSSCTVYSATVMALSTGTGTISFSNESVKAYSDSSEIFNTASMGQYTIEAPTLTGTISVSPANQTVSVGNSFNVSIIVDGGGTSFNAAQATVITSPNLSILSESNTPSSSGGCNLQYVASQNPSLSNLSFAGAILQSSSTNCTVYSATIQAVSAGIGTISLSNESIKKFTDSSEIFESANNGQYTVVAAAPTPAAAATPIPSNTPIPTSIPPSNGTNSQSIPSNNNTSGILSSNPTVNQQSNSSEQEGNNSSNPSSPVNTIRPTLPPTGPSHLLLFGGIGTSILILIGSLLILL